MELTQENCELIAPKGVFEWFDLIEGTCEGDTTAITFEEKDYPVRVSAADDVPLIEYRDRSIQIEMRPQNLGVMVQPVAMSP